MTRAGSNCDRPARGVVKGSGGLTRREGPNRDEATGATGSSCGNAPSGVAQARRDGAPLEADSDLLSAILEQGNLRRAWQQVKANRGAAGVDGITIDEFPDKFRREWPQLRRALEEGTYVPSPVRRVEMAKPDGGIRLLGIPTVLDRLIQQAIAQVLGPIFDPGFSDHSFGFRPGRCAGDAVRLVAKHIGADHRYAVDLDLSKFFDRVCHDILMSRLARKVNDRRVLRLIGRYLRAGVDVAGRYERTVGGVPQGGPLSPLLANVVLDDLDKELEQRGHRFARYADDFVILVKSPRAGERVMNSVRRFLERRLKLQVNAGKSAVRPTAELTFLGFAFKGVRIVWSEKSLQRFQHRIRELTSRSWGVSMEYRLRQLALYMRGWMGYFSLSETYAVVRQLDHWIRRRLRCCYWKMWKTRRQRIRQLLRLGVKQKDAILHGLGSHGCWAMSRTPAVNQALTRQWLRKQGLPSLTEQWVAIHYPTTVR